MRTLTLCLLLFVCFSISCQNAVAKEVAILKQREAERIVNFGEDLVKQICAECHNIKSKYRKMKGPTLWGIVGRKAASIKAYSYSDKFTAYIQNSSVIWNQFTLDLFLQNSTTFVDNSKMHLQAIKSKTIRDAIISYLQMLK